jgi:DNA-binding GntR family transcriptional regulator
MVKIDPILRATSLSDIAYERIRDSIFSGKMKPGEIYNEREIASQMQVSRTPVREALRQLAVESLVTSIPGRGFKVNRFFSRDIKEIYEFRMALEVAIVKKIAESPEQYNLIKAEQQLQKQREAMDKKDYDKFVKFDGKFHSELSKLIGNTRMETALDKSRDVSQLVADYKTMASGRGNEIIAEHEIILECLRQGEVAKAQKSMEKHLKESLLAVLKVLRKRDSLISE